jgi:hypothetical protein
MSSPYTIDDLKKAIENGANPDQTDRTGKTPLYWAQKKKHDDIARPLSIEEVDVTPAVEASSPFVLERAEAPAGAGSAGAADEPLPALLTETEIRSILAKVRHHHDEHSEGSLEQLRLIREFYSAVLDLGRGIGSPSKLVNITKWQRALFNDPLDPPASTSELDFYGIEIFFSLPYCRKVIGDPTFRDYFIEVIAEPKYQCKLLSRLFRTKNDEEKLVMSEHSLLPKLLSMGDVGREFSKKLLTSNHAISNWLQEKSEGDTKQYGLKCRILCGIVNLVYTEVPHDFHVLFIRELTCIPKDIVFTMSPEGEEKRPREFIKKLFDEAKRLSPYIKSLARLENPRIKLSEKTDLLAHIEREDDASEWLLAIFKYTNTHTSTILLDFLFERATSEEEPLRFKKFLSLLSAEKIGTLLTFPQVIVPLLRNERYSIDFFVTLISQVDFVEKMNARSLFSEVLFSEYFLGRLRIGAPKELSPQPSYELPGSLTVENYALKILSQSTKAIDALTKASPEIKFTVSVFLIEGLNANGFMNHIYEKINISECAIEFLLKALPKEVAEIDAMFVKKPEVKKILKDAKQKEKKRAKRERDQQKKLEKTEENEKKIKILEEQAKEAERRAQRAFEEKRELERIAEIQAREAALKKAEEKSSAKALKQERKHPTESDIEMTAEILHQKMKDVADYLSESEKKRLLSEFNLYHRLDELIGKNTPEALRTYITKSSPLESETESLREFFKLANELQEAAKKSKTDFSKAIKNRYWHDRVLERIKQILTQAENRKMHDILPLSIELTLEAPLALRAREKAIRHFKKLHGTSGVVVSAGASDRTSSETSRLELALAFMPKRVEVPTSSLSILPKPLALASDFPGREAEQRFSITEDGNLKIIFESYEKISSAYALIIASPEEDSILQKTRNYYAHTPCLVEALSPEGLTWLLDRWQEESQRRFIPMIQSYFDHLSPEDKRLLFSRRIFWLSQTTDPKIIPFLLAEIWEIGQAGLFDRGSRYHLNHHDKTLLRQLRNQTWHEVFGSEESLVKEDSYQTMHTLFSKHARSAEEDLTKASLSL